MKRIVITLTLECRDDIPLHVIRWMAENVTQHAAHEFADDYDAAFVAPSYVGPPLDGGVDWLAHSDLF